MTKYCSGGSSNVDPKYAGRAIGCGPSLEAIIAAIVDIADIPVSAIKTPDEPEEVLIAIIGSPIWAVMHRYQDGDFGYKLALDAMTTIDFHAIARQLATHLGVYVAWPDESTLCATAFIFVRPSGVEECISIDDSSVDGFTIVSAALGRGT